MSRFTSDPARRPRRRSSRPDGRRIVFTSTRGDNDLEEPLLAAGGWHGRAQRLTESENEQFPTSWHPNGKVLAFTEQDATGRPGTSRSCELEGDEASGFKPGKPGRSLNSSFSEIGRGVLPRRSLARVHVRRAWTARDLRAALPRSGRQVAGIHSRWLASHLVPKPASELFFQALDGSLMVAAYDARRPTRSARKNHGSGRRGACSLWGGFIRNFDLHPDGRRFAVLEPVDARRRRARPTTSSSSRTSSTSCAGSRPRNTDRCGPPTNESVRKESLTDARLSSRMEAFWRNDGHAEREEPPGRRFTAGSRSGHETGAVRWRRRSP